MNNLKKLFNKFMSLPWYYKLLISLVTICSGILLYYALKWLLGILIIIATVLFILTDGELFKDSWNRYKQSQNSNSNKFSYKIYHWLTEEGVSDLPISTLQYTQGVELDDVIKGIYFIHLNSDINEEGLNNFESKVRQKIRITSNNLIDCIVTKSKKEPYEAIKVRLCDFNELAKTRAQSNKEDF